MPFSRPSTALWAVAAGCALAACDRGNPAEAVATAPAGIANDPAFHARLRAAAAGLDEMGRVDDVARWAPTLCMAPLRPSLRISASADAATHGGKLYSIYAKDRAAYAALAEHLSGVSGVASVAGLEDCSQVLVKESFAPEEVTADAEDRAPRTFGPGGSSARFLRPAKKDGKRWRAGDSKGLFVMLRLDPKAAGTDDGWVYGTIAPDGTITSSGRVASCMSCHLSAPHGRVFGLPKDPGE
jgi:hypothetical protein